MSGQDNSENIRKEMSPQDDGINNEEKKEFIDRFGKDKGKKFYGAIKELEEFLDPQVMKDEDF